MSGAGFFSRTAPAMLGRPTPRGLSWSWNLYGDCPNNRPWILDTDLCIQPDVWPLVGTPDNHYTYMSKLCRGDNHGVANTFCAIRHSNNYDLVPAHVSGVRYDSGTGHKSHYRIIPCTRKLHDESHQYTGSPHHRDPMKRYGGWVYVLNRHRPERTWTPGDVDEYLDEATLLHTASWCAHMMPYAIMRFAKSEGMQVNEGIFWRFWDEACVPKELALNAIIEWLQATDMGELCQTLAMR